MNGKRIRFQAKCIHCGRVYAAQSQFGTGSLLRHRGKSPVKNRKSNLGQSVIQFNSDGSVGTWEYSDDVVRTQLCRLISRLDLPISLGATDAFEEYIKIAHNPRFNSVSRQTTGRDLVKYYSECRSKLMECFNSGVTSVAITSDIWSGNAKEDYLSVVSHFGNSDWLLEKRILGMRLIDVSHNGDNIAEHVHAVLEEYGLTEKAISDTLDNDLLILLL